MKFRKNLYSQRLNILALLIIILTHCHNSGIWEKWALFLYSEYGCLSLRTNLEDVKFKWLLSADMNKHFELLH